MKHTHEGGSGDERLDAALLALPQAVLPRRDLWSAIEAQLAPARGTAPARRRWRAAAAVLLVAVSSLVTAVVLRRGHEPIARAPAAADVHAVPAAFGPAHILSPEYQAARRQLSSMLQERLAQMPPSARQRLEGNLAELRRAAAEINAALALAPGDPLLEELLLNTYQDELAVLAAVDQLTSTNPAGGPVDATRMQL